MTGELEHDGDRVPDDQALVEAGGIAGERDRVLEERSDRLLALQLVHVRVPEERG